ncbi:MAG: class I SAM-dependent rRNA methyltransferase [Bacilli bacterium]|nr:class I SAM-dependent rRNA methyltransferase [Bacilli bacterium]
MKTRNYKKVLITKKQEKSILLGHPWIYKDEITSKEEIEDGEIVDVTNDKDKYLGSGFYNSKSKITIRLISRNANDTFDSVFFRRRIRYAIDYRLTVMEDNLNAFRVIFGEADELPGLTVDKFNDILVVQILSLGIEKRKDMILKLLYEEMKKNFDIKGIYIRNDVDIREKEGLNEYKGWFDLGEKKPSETKTTIVENDIKYIVDFENGQKTGFFLDQKYNRKAIRKIAKNRTVLDCCTHTGSFAMNAYLGGAKKVVALDISEKAIMDSKENFKLNNMNIETECKDVFDYLKELSEKKNKEFDFIILDPPAFTKSRKTIKNALKGYYEINYLALKSLKRGGYFATASCSHFASNTLFFEQIKKASIALGLRLKEVEYREASYDHPVLVGVEETRYLKFYIFQVI